MWFSFVFFIIIILADVGGFFKNPDPELLLRWYQVGFLSSYMIYSFFSFFFSCFFFFLAKLRGVVGREQRKFARGLRSFSVPFFPTDFLLLTPVCFYWVIPIVILS